MSDQLSRFRRQETPARAASTTTGSQAGKRPYEAFDKTGKPCPYTEIRCVTQPSQAPQSRFLMAVIFSADYDDAFSLIYSFLAVEIRGHNLKEVRRAIQNSRCEFIQEYHDNEFDKPARSDAIIESVKFITGEKLDDILSTYKGTK